MKNKTALFIIILNTLICLLLVSCGPNTKAPHDASQPIEEVFASDSKPYYISKPLKLEMIMSEVDHGLSKIKLDDSTTILIYRGVESCTMLQLK